MESEDGDESIFDGIVSKPFNLNDLQKIIEKATQEQLLVWLFQPISAETRQWSLICSLRTDEMSTYSAQSWILTYHTPLYHWEINYFWT